MAQELYELTLTDFERLAAEERQAIVDRAKSTFRHYPFAEDRSLSYDDVVVAALRSGYPVPDSVIEQRGVYAEERHEAAHAAWGPNTDLTLLEERGFSIRMADGQPVARALRDQVGSGMAAVEAALGLDASLWRKVGLTIIHTGGAPPSGLPTALGCFTPSASVTITLGPCQFPDPPLQNLAHEVVHLLDCLRQRPPGRVADNLYHSMLWVDAAAGDEDAEREEALFRRALDTMRCDGRECDCRNFRNAAYCECLQREDEYYGCPKEMFARLGEQYIALRTSPNPTATHPCDVYWELPFHWPRDAFAALADEVGAALERRRVRWLGRDWPATYP